MSAGQEFVLAVARIFCIVFGIACTSLTILGVIAFRKSEQDAAGFFAGVIQKSGLLEMITVILIAVATSNLRVLDKISAEATIGIFSGIVGYVLGGIVTARIRSGNRV